MVNEKRAKEIIEKYGFDFDKIPKDEIRKLIEKEIADYVYGSSEYIRLLCGYLYCIGDKSDIPLLKRAKYDINMDVGCMIDIDWINSLENNGLEGEFIPEKKELVSEFVKYYTGFYKNY